VARKRPLSEQVVVIGDGSYGLGRAIAERAKARGASVVIGARTEEALDSARVDLALETDVADRAQVERLVRLRWSGSAASTRTSPTAWPPSTPKRTGSRTTSSGASST